MIVANKPKLSAVQKTQRRPNAPQQPRAPVQKAPTGGGGGGRHTLMLMQSSTGKGSRSWEDYANIGSALDAFVSIYEKQLKALNPGLATLTYSAADLHAYIDELTDLSVLVLDPQTKQYAPHGKEYIKGAILTHLKKAAK